MNIKFTAGQLIKMGKFKDAIPEFSSEIHEALAHNVLNRMDMLMLWEEFSQILLNPSNYDQVQKLGDQMMMLAMRIPGYLKFVSQEEFYNNVKLNYETIKTND